jgi:ABC-type antimicrobial peptide transport system permease subunit
MLAPALQQLIRRVDVEMPLNDVRSMDVRVADGLIARRSPALLTGVFAGVALLLAAVGTFGALAYAVSQRRREIGVRMALGALPQQVGRQFLGMGLRLLAGGFGLGVLGALLSGRIMQGLLFDTPAVHVPTLLMAALVLGAVTVVACLLPSLRASRVDPMEAMRCE